MSDLLHPSPNSLLSANFLKFLKEVEKNWPSIRNHTDLAIQNKISRLAKNSIPDVRCYGEEDGPRIQFEPKKISLLIDPIDGTHNRERSLPYYSISLALFSEGKVICSAVFIPEWHWLFCGMDDFSYISNVFGISKLNVRRYLPKGERVISLFKKQILTMGQVPEKIRSTSCSSIDICLVAKGALDAFVDHIGYEKQCDVAAALHILTLAGGCYQYGHHTDPLSAIDPEWLKPRKLIALSNEEYQNDYSFS